MIRFGKETVFNNRQFLNSSREGSLFMYSSIEALKESINSIVFEMKEIQKNREVNKKNKEMWKAEVEKQIKSISFEQLLLERDSSMFLSSIYYDDVYYLYDLKSKQKLNSKRNSFLETIKHIGSHIKTESTSGTDIVRAGNDYVLSFDSSEASEPIRWTLRLDLESWEPIYCLSFNFLEKGMLKDVNFYSEDESFDGGSKGTYSYNKNQILILINPEYRNVPIKYITLEFETADIESIFSKTSGKFFTEKRIGNVEVLKAKDKKPIVISNTEKIKSLNFLKLGGSADFTSKRVFVHISNEETELEIPLFLSKEEHYEPVFPYKLKNGEHYYKTDFPINREVEIETNLVGPLSFSADGNAWFSSVDLIPEEVEINQLFIKNGSFSILENSYIKYGIKTNCLLKQYGSLFVNIDNNDSISFSYPIEPATVTIYCIDYEGFCEDVYLNLVLK